MNDAALLLQAVITSPHEDTPRLMLADEIEDKIEKKNFIRKALSIPRKS